MLTPILASQLSDTGVPWWWQTVFVPVAIGLLSASLSFLATLFLARRTEWYRRLTRWEPYGKELWLRQIAICSEIFQTAQPAMNVVTTFFEQLTDEAKERLLASRREAFTKLYRVRIETSVFLPERFNQLYGKFIAYLTELAFGAEKKCSPELEQSLRRTWIEMQVVYQELLNEARASLGVDALSESTLKAVTPERENGSRVFDLRVP